MPCPRWSLEVHVTCHNPLFILRFTHLLKNYFDSLWWAASILYWVLGGWDYIHYLLQPLDDISMRWQIICHWLRKLAGPSKEESIEWCLGTAPDICGRATDHTKGSWKQKSEEANTQKEGFSGKVITICQGHSSWFSAVRVDHRLSYMLSFGWGRELISCSLKAIIGIIPWKY